MLLANNINRKSWIKYDSNSDFPIQNIPFGVFKTNKNEFHIASRIGDTIISLKNLEKYGFFEDLCLTKDTFQGENLNKLLKQNKSIWRSVRNKICDLFDLENIQAKEKISKENILFEHKKIEMVLPIKIGDYTDFYSSKDHATNVGKMFRDPENALLPNWLHIPVGYHGRSSSIVISGSPVKRPKGKFYLKMLNYLYFLNVNYLTLNWKWVLSLDKLIN